MTNILLGIIKHWNCWLYFQSWTNWKRGAESMNNVSLTGRSYKRAGARYGRTIAQLYPFYTLR